MVSQSCYSPVGDPGVGSLVVQGVPLVGREDHSGEGGLLYELVLHWIGSVVHVQGLEYQSERFLQRERGRG